MYLHAQVLAVVFIFSCFIVFFFSRLIVSPSEKGDWLFLLSSALFPPLMFCPYLSSKLNLTVSLLFFSKLYSPLSSYERSYESFCGLLTRVWEQISASLTNLLLSALCFFMVIIWLLCCTDTNSKYVTFTATRYKQLRQKLGMHDMKNFN